ncbi:MAG: hypothetical protein RL513_1119, partial [Pseudomonadota bacterium]
MASKTNSRDTATPHDTDLNAGL